MDLEQLGKHDNRLNLLIARSQEWRKLDGLVKQILPSNLHDYVQVACVERGCLVLLVSHAMAASRMRMLIPALLPRLQKINHHISDVRTKLIPHTSPPPTPKPHQLSEHALEQFRQSAQKLQHHPKLAAALTQLVNRHSQ